MQHLQILAVGKLGERWQAAAIDEYQKRISPYFKLAVTELPESRLPQNPTSAQIAQALEAEAAGFRRKIPPRAEAVALCVEGAGVSSPQLAGLIARAAGESRTLVFLIGSSYGLSEGLKGEAGHRISLSAMTFPHQLARLLLCEQIYRCGQILSGGKYHK